VRKPKPVALTRAERNIEWIEHHCKIPEGKDVGKPVVLREWQRDIIRLIYDNPHGTRQAIISMPRKNAKTALVGFLLLLHLCGPEAKPNSQLYSAAQSKDQAATIFKLAAKIVRMSPTLVGFVVIRDTIKELACPEIGTLYGALSAEKSTAHGKSPIFAVHDELGQVAGPVSELYDAVETGMGAHDEPLSIIISTQAPTDNDLLSRLIDEAATGKDPRTVLKVHAAPPDADPFSEATLKACNPAWGDFLNAEEVLRTRDKAIALPSQEASYRNLHLNQRVDMAAPFVSQGVWQACDMPVIEEFDGLPVFGGLDLSEVSDLTALALIAPVEGVWHVKPTFWLPGAGLAEKARADRVPYDVWARQGYLQPTPGATVDYAYVADHLAALVDRLDVRKIAFDRWNWRHLKPWLARAGFTHDQLEGDNAVFEEMGQGFQSMSPALRDLESALLNKRIAHGGHPVLESCARNVTVQSDPAGNRKFSKAKSHGRIDGMVALAMAMSVAGTWENTTAQSVYLERGALVM
jgi:phage terminase large subunit-like protein